MPVVSSTSYPPLHCPPGARSVTGGRRPAFLSVDCDSQIDYFRTYNLSRSSSFADRVYTDGLPRLLDLFARAGVRATFFLVGREARKMRNLTVLRRIVEEGHEVGNHSLTHPPNFASYGPSAKAYEVDGAHSAIAEATGREPVGFRAPVYGIDRVALDLLEERGYLYDSSVFPSAFFALQQEVIRFKSRNRSSRVRAGNPLWHFAPKKPYRPDGRAVWRRGGRRIWEVPITVVPGLNLPFYGTFVLWAGMGYFKTAFSLVSLWAPSLVFQYHPMEVMTIGEDGIDPRLARLPGLSRPISDKEHFIQACLERMSKVYEFLPGREFLERTGCVREAN